MGSSGKKRTTMAKLNRETRLLERRAEKNARKAARKLEAAREAERGDAPGPADDDDAGAEPTGAEPTQ